MAFQHTSNLLGANLANIVKSYLVDEELLKDWWYGEFLDCVCTIRDGWAPDLTFLELFQGIPGVVRNYELYALLDRRMHAFASAEFNLLWQGGRGDEVRYHHTFVSAQIKVTSAITILASKLAAAGPLVGRAAIQSSIRARLMQYADYYHREYLMGMVLEDGVGFGAEDIISNS